MLFLDSAIFVIFPLFQQKSLYIPGFIKSDVRLLNTIDSYQLMKILLLNKYFFSGNWRKKFFDFL
uniref:Uncharacterized protein n=1 Tax=Bacillus cereus TaxID=1396 RepID=Q8GCI0_BACCE|nr:unknown [Bacillus cereus]